MSHLDDVREFNERFGLPHDRDGRAPTLLAPDVLEFRLKFLREELAEFKQAHAAGDLAGCLDALVDLEYVLLGTSLMMALPHDAGWDEVHSANMQKERVERANQSKRGHAWDLRKPEGWRPPDHLPALRAAGWKG